MEMLVSILYGRYGGSEGKIEKIVVLVVRIPNMIHNGFP